MHGKLERSFYSLLKLLWLVIHGIINPFISILLFCFVIFNNIYNVALFKFYDVTTCLLLYVMNKCSSYGPIHKAVILYLISRSH
jgi:hypothetical protein